MINDKTADHGYQRSRSLRICASVAVQRGYWSCFASTAAAGYQAVASRRWTTSTATSSPLNLARSNLILQDVQLSDVQVTRSDYQMHKS